MNINIDVFLHPDVIIWGIGFLAFVGVLVFAFFYLKHSENKEKPMSRTFFITFLIKVYAMFLDIYFY
ncbi:hypothetical protein QI033_12935 [Staphylococcus saprophyticus]|nr:hypothetical protein [Staphylococcus saprophyticus]